MSEWNFMDPASKDNVLRAVRYEAERFFGLVSQPDGWERPTAAANWQVRDHVGHMVDTTEGYFKGFDAARGNGSVPDPLGVRDMAGYVDEGARSFRGTPQDEMVERLRADYGKMQEILNGLTDEDWTGLIVPHKYMGPLPSGWYSIFQLVDYAVHSWDIREGTGRAHALDGDSADLLVPFALLVWQSTAVVDEGTEPFDIGIRISGRNGGDILAHVSPEGFTLTPGSVDGAPVVLDFDAASFVLTAYGRFNGGTARGDASVAERFCNLFFRI